MADKKEKATIETVVNPVNKMIDTLVSNAQIALQEFLSLDQEQIDHIVHEMALAGLDKHQELARMAVEETGRGIYEDKVIKNMFATEYIWHDIKKEKTVGVLDENEMEGFVEVAEPVGVIAGVTPTTNPTSTTLFKALVAVKTRNPIIFGFHPSAQKCSAEAARIVYEAAVKAGAPKNCVQWISEPSIDATGALMNHPGVSTILATGGPGMVKAAYSCGKPALGVGPGNVPCFIEKSADLHRACTDLMMSKTFDNGMICASEQAVIVEKEIAKDFESYMKANNCYFLNKEEVETLTKYMFPDPNKGVFAPVVGRSASWIAEQAGLTVPAGTKILLAPLPEPSEKYPMSKEKLSPVLAYFIAKDQQQGFDFANKMLELGGLGFGLLFLAFQRDVGIALGGVHGRRRGRRSRAGLGLWLGLQGRRRGLKPGRGLLRDGRPELGLHRQRVGLLTPAHAPTQRAQQQHMGEDGQAQRPQLRRGLWGSKFGPIGAGGGHGGRFGLGGEGFTGPAGPTGPRAGRLRVAARP